MLSGYFGEYFQRSSIMALSIRSNSTKSNDKTNAVETLGVYTSLRQTLKRYHRILKVCVEATRNSMLND